MLQRLFSTGIAAVIFLLLGSMNASAEDQCSIPLININSGHGEYCEDGSVPHCPEGHEIPSDMLREFTCPRMLTKGTIHAKLDVSAHVDGHNENCGMTFAIGKTINNVPCSVQNWTWDIAVLGAQDSSGDVHIIAGLKFCQVGNNRKDFTCTMNGTISIYHTRE